MQNSTENSLDRINKTRIKKLETLMTQHDISSIKKLCELVGIQPAAISRMLSNQKLPEKHARRIESHFDLPNFWLDINEFPVKQDIPVYLFNEFKGIKASTPSFFIKKAIDSSEFYIKLNQSIGIISENYFLRFQPVTHIPDIRKDDLCIIKDKKSNKFHITQFLGDKFKEGHIEYVIVEIELIAKCIAIEA